MDSNLTVISESLESIEAHYRDKNNSLNWNLVFTTPAWLKVWWGHFGAGAELFIRSVYQNGRIIGIAPLQIRGKTASFVGNTDVCDYQDFILAPGREDEFFAAWLDDLLQKGLTDLHLETIRPDSYAATHLIAIARSRGYVVDYHQSDVSFDVELPKSWEEYLSNLDGKQRHEIKRKTRNLHNMGQSRYYCTSDKNDIPSAMETFLKLFPESRGDKAQFMTLGMQDYFRSLALSLSESGAMRFGTLEFEGKPAAMVMYFDYNGNMYLYNSAYDPAYRAMSVGIISKIGCIRDGIEKGKKRFDFLKGPESYKAYLGGREITLFSCHVNLK